ncbi:MAG: methionine ABC transporter ATP-binding protein [Deltaproteobacteria bacterium CG11_big_fil_rev_8_21_14_0_20_49_13]|nr:MAG: methionine ABC transporter ATP-binding protein [Deltaproteobacteria bacterium CG11_big_fil_rev_8_21_14_0_20_49_13]
MTLLDIKNLRTYFDTEAGLVKAVDGVDLSLERGEIVAVVGGSGSGKTILALSILKLVPEPGKIVSGEISYNGIDLVKLPASELRKVRGGKISMIFQEPMTALNPVFTIENQISEAILTHDKTFDNRAAPGRTAELLSMVGIPDPVKKMKAYPNELSGGMRQRVMIAMALASKPDILIADEPTTALDVTIQAQILELIASLQVKLGMAVIFITHDFGIVAQVAHRVYVMHDGRVVESGKVGDVFERPKDDYTKKLLATVPVL